MTKSSNTWTMSLTQWLHDQQLSHEMLIAAVLALWHARIARNTEKSPFQQHNDYHEQQSYWELNFDHRRHNALLGFPNSPLQWPHCHRIGHLARTCRESRQDREKSGLYTAFIADHNSWNQSSSTWYHDYGSNAHIANNILSTSADVRSSQNVSAIGVGNGATVYTHGTTHIDIGNLTLQDVLLEQKKNRKPDLRLTGSRKRDRRNQLQKITSLDCKNENHHRNWKQKEKSDWTRYH